MTNLEKNFCPNYQWKTLITSNGLEEFLQICIGVMDKIAPQRKKCIRGKNISLMNKTITQAQVIVFELHNLEI